MYRREQSTSRRPVPAGRFVASLILVSLSSWITTTAAGDRPNIVILVSDDLDYGKLGYTGYKAAKTPHLDSVIRGGTFFAQGYVSGPVCAPTRAGLMTGRYQARMRYETLTGPIRRQIADDYGVDTREVLLPQLLKKAGYETAVIGKWHLGYNDKYHPNQRGVNYFFGFLAGGHDYFIWDTPAVAAAGGPILRNKQKVQGEGYVTEALALEAGQFIEKNKDKPFFLYYSPYNVHAPKVVPKKYLPASGDVVAGMVKALDDSVGVILDALRKSDLLDKTLIVYVNDNGGTGNNTPFRGRKGQFYEGGVRVPFAMRWPGRIPAGKVYDRAVIQLDILPTVVAAAGGVLPKDREFDGVNLLPYLTGREKTAPHKSLFWRYPKRGRAARVGDFKLVWLPRRAPQLFNLKNDPAEANNIATANPMIVSRLKRAIRDWETTVDSSNQYRSSRK